MSNLERHGNLALDIQGLVVEFHTMDGVVHAVNGLDLSIQQGTTLGLVGETGAGKTTTALSVLRLLAQPAGRIVSGTIRLGGGGSAKQERAGNGKNQRQASLHDFSGPNDLP